MRHLSDEQLIEVHYLEASAEWQGHLAMCKPCSDRLSAIVSGLQRAAASGVDSAEERPDSFWLRQRVAIDRAIDRGDRSSGPRTFPRWAAAAAAVLLVLGLITVPRFLPSRTADPVVSAAPSPAPVASSTALDVIEDVSSLEDPWESEELRPFGAAVEWETWETEQHTRNNS